MSLHRAFRRLSPILRTAYTEPKYCARILNLHLILTSKESQLRTNEATVDLT